MTNTITNPRFDLDAAGRAFDEWGANCGPGAIAAIMGLTLDEVKPFMMAAGFGPKRYTNPTMMNDVLRAIGRQWCKIGAEWPYYGLARIQWEGPWTEPGANPKWKYRQTHWVGAMRSETNGIGIFDINCMNNGSGWCSLKDWSEQIVPHLTALYPRANGKWHITHAIEVSRT